MEYNPIYGMIYLGKRLRISMQHEFANIYRRITEQHGILACLLLEILLLFIIVYTDYYIAF